MERNAASIEEMELISFSVSIIKFEVVYLKHALYHLIPLMQEDCLQEAQIEVLDGTECY